MPPVPSLVLRGACRSYPTCSNSIPAFRERECQAPAAKPRKNPKISTVIEMNVSSVPVIGNPPREICET